MNAKLIERIHLKSFEFLNSDLSGIEYVFNNGGATTDVRKTLEALYLQFKSDEARNKLTTHTSRAYSDRLIELLTFLNNRFQTNNHKLNI